MNKLNFKSQCDLIWQILVKVTVVSFILPLPYLERNWAPPLPLFGELLLSLACTVLLSKMSWWDVGGKVLSPSKVPVSGQQAPGIRSHCRMQEPEAVICWTCFVLLQHKAKAHVLLIGGFKIYFPTLSQNILTPLVRHQKCHNKVWNIVLRQTAILEGQDKKSHLWESCTDELVCSSAPPAERGHPIWAIYLPLLLCIFSWTAPGRASLRDAAWLHCIPPLPDKLQEELDVTLWFLGNKSSASYPVLADLFLLNCSLPIASYLVIASGRLWVCLGRDGTQRFFCLQWSDMVSICAEQESCFTKSLGILNWDVL